MNDRPLDIHSVARPASRESLVDILDRVLDKGVVIAGDVVVSLLDIELLTIKVRLLIASADKAKEMGIDWWQRDPHLSSAAERAGELRRRDDLLALKRQNDDLRRELMQMKLRLNQFLDHDAPASSSPKRQRAAGD